MIASTFDCGPFSMALVTLSVTWGAMSLPLTILALGASAMALCLVHGLIDAIMARRLPTGYPCPTSRTEAYWPARMPNPAGAGAGARSDGAEPWLPAYRRGCGCSSRNIWKAQSLVVLQCVFRGVVSRGQWPLRECLKVRDACIAPPLRFFFLDSQECADLCKAFGVYPFGKARPRVAHSGDCLNAACVVDDEFVPQRSSRPHPVVPRDMVEPEQQAFWSLIEVSKAGCHRRCVLSERVAASGRPVESHTLSVRTIEIRRCRIILRFARKPGGRSVMRCSHLMRQPKWGHVLNRRFTRTQHHLHRRRDEAGVVRERRPYPFFSDVARRQSRIPREPAKGKPVGLVKVGAGPIPIRADIGDARDAGIGVPEQRAVDQRCHRGTLASCVGIRAEYFLEHGPEIDQVSREAEILLRDLHLQHHGSLRHCTEQWMERLAGLEVDGSVLDLQYDVAPKLPIQRREFLERFFRAIVGLILRVNECTPHHDAAMRRQCVCKHIGAVSMRTGVILRTGLSLGMSFHEEAAEVRNECVNLIGLRAPPVTHGRVQRIRCAEPADFDWCTKAGGQIHTQSVGAKHIGESRE